MRVCCVYIYIYILLTLNIHIIVLEDSDTAPKVNRHFTFVIGSYISLHLHAATYFAISSKLEPIGGDLKSQ